MTKPPRPVAARRRTAGHQKTAAAAAGGGRRIPPARRRSLTSPSPASSPAGRRAPAPPGQPSPSPFRLPTRPAPFLLARTSQPRAKRPQPYPAAPIACRSAPPTLPGLPSLLPRARIFGSLKDRDPTKPECQQTTKSRLAAEATPGLTARPGPSQQYIERNSSTSSDSHRTQRHEPVGTLGQWKFNRRIAKRRGRFEQNSGF